MAYGVAREIFAQIRSATKTQKRVTKIMTLVDCYSDSFSLANRIFLKRLHLLHDFFSSRDAVEYDRGV